MKENKGQFGKGENNPNFGKPKSEEWKQMMREKLSGSNHPSWKGENCALRTLHQWIAKNKPKPSFCEKCGKVPPIDVANISGKYKRDIEDFEWLCRRCHMKSDDRIKNSTKRLNAFGKQKIKNTIKKNEKIDRMCPKCGSFWIVNRGIAKWTKEGKLQQKQRFGCKNCRIRFTGN